MSDRTVHGLTDIGDEIVRYNVLYGPWYIEPPGQVRPRQKASAKLAAYCAARGTWYEGLPGGTMFDAEVRRVRSRLLVQP